MTGAKQSAAPAMLSVALAAAMMWYFSGEQSGGLKTSKIERVGQQAASEEQPKRTESGSNGTISGCSPETLAARALGIMVAFKAVDHDDAKCRPSRMPD